MYCTKDMLGVSMDMLSVNVYKSYKDMIYIFLTLVHMIHVLMDLAFSHDLVTNGKKVSSSNFCWCGIKVSHIPLPHFFI
jgi:hypothetical protein